MTAPTKDLRPPLSPRRRRLSGLALLVVILVFVTFCLALFNKVFKPTDTVTLEASTVGNQFSKQGDVKIRGIIVGEVTSVETDGQKATVELAIDPDAISTIPSDTRARLVPKTLFGERYVSLSVPPGDSARPLAEGDTITEDRTKNTTETEAVLNNLLPVLTAVQPQKLSDTLGAISMALSGRGEQIGDTFVNLNGYLAGLNPALPDLVANLQRIPQVADIYNQATPDLLAALNNLVVTGQTLVQMRSSLEQTFRSVTSASNVTADFLAANRDNIIQLAATGRPILELLARYSPEFPCLLQQLTDLTPKINNVLRPDTGIQIAAELTVPRGKYVPSDAPQNADRRGPRCYTVTGGDAPQNPPGGPPRDGAAHPEAEGNPPTFLDSLPDLGPLLTGGVPPNPVSGAQGTGVPGSPVTGGTGLPANPLSPVVPNSGPGRVDAANIAITGTPNSPEDRELVTELTALQMQTLPGQVPAFAPFLTGSTLRGLPVSIR